MTISTLLESLQRAMAQLGDVPVLVDKMNDPALVKVTRKETGEVMMMVVDRPPARTEGG